MVKRDFENFIKSNLKDLSLEKQVETLNKISNIWIPDIIEQIEFDNKIITLKDGIRIASAKKRTSISIKKGKICIITNGYKYTFKEASMKKINKLMSYLDENGVEFEEIIFIPNYCIDFLGRKAIILDADFSKVGPVHGDLKITLK